MAVGDLLLYEIPMMIKQDIYQHHYLSLIIK